jgi:hypothetical protein
VGTAAVGDRAPALDVGGAEDGDARLEGRRVLDLVVHVGVSLALLVFMGGALKVIPVSQKLPFPMKNCAA